MNNKLNAALEYLSFGWCIFPTGRDKSPLVEWKRYQSGPPDAETVQKWFATDNNIGAATGTTSGFVVIDTDSDESDKRFHDYIGGKPSTVSVKTPRGTHYYFLAPDVPTKNKIKFLPSVDFRGDGGFVMMPPSVNADGEMYEWIKHPSECLMAPLPPRVLERVRADKQDEPPAAHTTTPPPPTGITRWAAVALENEISTLLGTTQGYRNQQLNNSALNLFQLTHGGELNESDVRSQLTAAAASIGLTAHETEKTIKSAYEAAKRKPRRAPQRPNITIAKGDLPEPLAPTESATATEPASHLPQADYFEKNGCTYWLKPNGEERVPTLICRFACSIVEEIRLWNRDNKTLFRIEGETSLGRRFNFEILADDFSDNKKLKAAIFNAAGSDVYIKRGMTGHIEPAIQCLTDHEQKVLKTQYSRTGWLDDKSTFLIPGMSIGEDELVLGRDLPFDLTAEADMELGINALRELTQCQPMAVTTIAIATLFAAPLSRVAGWSNNRTGVFITGRTGSLKSSFAGAAMCLYGPGWINDQTWISWGDTVNSIMSICVEAEDLPILIDNYKPVIHAGPRELIRLIHGIFEGGEKRRLNRNAERRTHHSTLTWPVFTGEDVPDCDASTIARLLVIQFPLAGVDSKTRIGYAQDNSHHLSALGKAWIEWLADRDNQELIKSVANQSRFNHHRAKWAEKLSLAAPKMVNTLRVATNLTINQMAWKIMGMCPALTEYCSDFGAHHEAGLMECGTQMGERTRESLEANRLLDTVMDLLATQRYILVHRTANMPATAAGDHIIGWEDEKHIYLLVRPVLKAVADYLGRDGLGNISDRTLFKQLDDIGAIAERGNGTMTKSVRVSDQIARVLVLKRAALYPDSVESYAAI